VAAGGGARSPQIKHPVVLDLSGINAGAGGAGPAAVAAPERKILGPMNWRQLAAARQRAAALTLDTSFHA